MKLSNWHVTGWGPLLICSRAICKVNGSITNRIRLKFGCILLIVVILFIQKIINFSTTFAQSLCEEVNSISVVQLRSSNVCDRYGNCQRPTYGNGIVVNPEDNIILTAYHVVVDDESSSLFKHIIIRSFNSSDSYKAELLAVEPQRDLALLQVTQDLGGAPLSTEPFSNTVLPLILPTSEITQSDKVFIIGNWVYGGLLRCHETSVILSNPSDSKICVEGTLKEGYSPVCL